MAPKGTQVRLTPSFDSALQVTTIVVLLYFHGLWERHTVWTNEKMHSFGMIFLTLLAAGNQSKVRLA
jgi:hypothetical protein